jgi:hypothetical protein
MSEEKNTTANRPVRASPAGSKAPFENLYETQVGPCPQDLDARSCTRRASFSESTRRTDRFASPVAQQKALVSPKVSSDSVAKANEQKDNHMTDDIDKVIRCILVSYVSCNRLLDFSSSLPTRRFPYQIF